MHCHVNGERRPLGSATTTIGGLVAELGLAGRKVAVERNGEIVPRSAHGRTPVADGDRIEIVAAVGGG